jgi:serine/threonine protein kinase
VYLAEHVHDHSQAAVKLLQLQVSSREDMRDFLNEARIIRLRHPHIVSVLDFGLSREDLPYLVMEYARGGTLRDRHPRNLKVPSDTVITYVLQLASALQYAHDRRIIISRLNEYVFSFSEYGYFFLWSHSGSKMWAYAIMTRFPRHF